MQVQYRRRGRKLGVAQLIRHYHQEPPQQQQQQRFEHHKTIRWFLGMNAVGPSFDRSTFAKTVSACCSTTLPDSSSMRWFGEWMMGQWPPLRAICASLLAISATGSA
jgi:hypothetical protein